MDIPVRPSNLVTRVCFAMGDTQADLQNSQGNSSSTSQREKAARLVCSQCFPLQHPLMLNTPSIMNISILQMAGSLLFPHTVLLAQFNFYCSSSEGYSEKVDRKCHFILNYLFTAMAEPLALSDGWNCISPSLAVSLTIHSAPEWYLLKKLHS